jgi:penicillin-binding protein 2
VAFKERLLPLLGLKELPKGPAVLKAGVPEHLLPTLAELVAGQKNLKLVERIERTYPSPISGPVLGYVLLANAEQVKRATTRRRRWARRASRPPWSPTCGARQG